eukprot:COSAG04_NODE_4700_length_1940_cov_1.062466_1_plen_68_part_00
MPNPCELPRHMYYLSYSADGEQAHPPAGMYPSAPCTPEPDGCVGEKAGLCRLPSKNGFTGGGAAVVS